MVAGDMHTDFSGVLLCCDLLSLHRMMSSPTRGKVGRHVEFNYKL